METSKSVFKADAYKAEWAAKFTARPGKFTLAGNVSGGLITPSHYSDEEERGLSLRTIKDS